MANNDYMNVIGVLTKTMKMDALDIQRPDASGNILEITMGAPARQEKKFSVVINGPDIELSCAAEYFSDKEFEAWGTNFEYELEQALLRNVGVAIRTNAGRRVVTLKL